jgi:poly(glycerol-phosphate) alpha-glucosyltransferase
VFWGPAFGAEKTQLFRSADAFILPSLSEGLPMAVLEAWAHGLPVVITPECNLSEAFMDEAAIRINPDAQSISVGLEELFSMPDSELQAMGARGRQLVEQRFSWKMIAHQMKQVYDWLVGGGVEPECVIK